MSTQQKEGCSELNKGLIQKIKVDIDISIAGKKEIFNKLKLF